MRATQIAQSSSPGLGFFIFLFLFFNFSPLETLFIHSYAKWLSLWLFWALKDAEA